MRKFTVAGTVALLFAVCSIAATEEPADLRDVGRLAFDGHSSFQSRDLVNVLRFDFDVARAAHPDVNLVEYLRSIERTLLIAYRHSGFRAASIEASYDRRRPEVFVIVQEGSRHLCGSIQITGCSKATADALIKSLTTADDPDEVLWREGQAAPFDDVTAAEIRRRIDQTLAGAGLFGAKFDLQITAEPGLCSFPKSWPLAWLK